MSQADNILTSFKTRLLADEALPALLPGDLHHGMRVDTEIVRPFALMVVKEKERESSSGNTALVKYEATLKVIGEQSATGVGDILRAFSAAFDLSFDLPDVTGNVVMIYPLTSEIVEDVDSEFGKDIVVGTMTWEIQISEIE